jgi:hypothetical protein
MRWAAARSTQPLKGFLPSTQGDRTMKNPSRIISVIALIASCAAAGIGQEKPRASGFSREDCISNLTKEVDPPYRLSPVQATRRCNEIALRVAKLSKQVVGKWQRRGPKGKIETMEIYADGTARSHRYKFDTQKMEDFVEQWAVVNPYGTIGEEKFELPEGLLWSVKFLGATMIIESQPADALIVERWKRMK